MGSNPSDGTAVSASFTGRSASVARRFVAVEYMVTRCIMELGKVPFSYVYTDSVSNLMENRTKVGQADPNLLWLKAESCVPLPAITHPSAFGKAGNDNRQAQYFATAMRTMWLFDACKCNVVLIYPLSHRVASISCGVLSKSSTNIFVF